MASRDPQLSNTERRRTYRQLSRAAKRLIYDVAPAESGPCSPSDLETLLRKHLQQPIGEDDREPPLPKGGASVIITHGSKLCASARPEKIKIGLPLIIDGLHLLAKHGDRAALHALVDSATHAALAVKELSRYEPDFVRPLARVVEEWPSTIANHTDWDEENAEFVRDLEVGAESLVVARKRIKKTRRDGQEDRRPIFVLCERLVDIVDAAREWHSQIDRYMRQPTRGRRPRRGVSRNLELPTTLQWTFEAAKLDGLDAAAPAWFKVGWEGFKFLTLRPHELPGELERIGRWREDQKARRQQTTPGKRRGNRRSGLQERVKPKFLKLFGAVASPGDDSER